MMKFLVLLLAGTLAAAPTDRGAQVIVPSLKGLVFVSDAKDIQKMDVPANGISCVAVPLLDQPDFEDQLTAYIGQPLTFEQLDRITAKVSAFYRQHNHPLVDVVAPEQDLHSGVIRIVVNEFRVGEVRVQGNRWFSDDAITAPISFQHGDTVDSARLLDELQTVNANSFRHVDLVYQPSSQPGYTDLVLDTKDRFPVSVYSGFDNSGTPVTGRSRWNLGVTWGNAFLHDQTLSYQFSASDNFFSRSGPVGFLGNSLSWSMPVRANDTLSIFGGYQKSLPNIGTDFGFVGKSGQAGIRYSLGLHRSAHFIQSVQFGYDFKTTNNNLAFGGVEVSKTSAEIDQFPLSYAANLTDKYGASSLNTSLVYSPGGITPNNTTTAFRPDLGQSGIPLASAHYVYWRSDFTRLSKLPEGMTHAFRMLGQTSSANLLYTEKLAGSGTDLMRGYDPYTVIGDKGILISNELRAPAITPWPERGLGQAQFYMFWDYGHLMAAHAVDGQVNSLSGSSVGTGMRYTLRTNLTGNIDYGRALIQLPNTNSSGRNSFVGLALTVAY